MKLSTLIMATMANILLLTSFNNAASGDHHGEAEQHHSEGHHDEEHHEEKKGPNNGKLLNDGAFSLELVLLERGQLSQYRIYPRYDHKEVSTEAVKVTVKLKRLGNHTDVINFKASGKFLTGDTNITVPHSFEVDINAEHQGKRYHWHYENFEGRTQISDKMATQMNVTTGVVGPKQLTETLNAYGKLTLAPNAQRHVSARFPGHIIQLNVELGQQVKKGQKLMVIESNEGLQNYSLYAPITGVITEQNTAEGEQSLNSNLLTITNTSELIAELNIYPLDQHKVSIGAAVELSSPSSKQNVNGKVFDALPHVNNQQAKVFRVKVNNSQGHFSIGQFVSANIAINTFKVPLALHTNALQSFNNFTVVYEKVAQQYEVRMLTLGRKAGQWVEVLSGINAGSEYVIENSYLIKADIAKAGAAHEH